MGVWLGPKKKKNSIIVTQNDIKYVGLPSNQTVLFQKNGNHWEAALRYSALPDNGAFLIISKDIYVDLFLINKGFAGQQITQPVTVRILYGQNQYGEHLYGYENMIQGGTGGNGGKWIKYNNVFLPSGTYAVIISELTSQNTRLFNSLSGDSHRNFIVPDNASYSQGGNGALSGNGIIYDSYYYHNASNGSIGVKPWDFGESLLYKGKYFGAGGGGGGAIKDSATHHYSIGGNGGATNGGKGGSNYGNGENGNFYGAGGGGSFGEYDGSTVTPHGAGSGYQGIILIRDHRG